MKKNELKTGMVVQFNNQELGFILGNGIYDGEFDYTEDLYNYTNDLKYKMVDYEDIEYRIDKVFEINSDILDIKELFNIITVQFHKKENVLEYLLDNDYLNLSWERQDIDWE